LSATQGAASSSDKHTYMWQIAAKGSDNNLSTIIHLQIKHFFCQNKRAAMA